MAKRLDKVEVFGLTRVVMPKVLDPKLRKIPGELKLVVKGLPDHFRGDAWRQGYKSLSDGMTEVTIRAANPSREKRAALPVKDPDGGENLKANLIVESDHPEIRALAKKLAGEEKDPYEVAKRISTWVHQNMQRDYGSSADRASDVLRQLKGDCTEHSLLAEALMRAAGVPARRVDGLVYMVNEDGIPALYWHEWVEAWVGEWTALDPTFDQTVADATHLALGQEGGAEITPLIGQLKVVEVR
jgi:transglutaminase-like putative cysteine protease